MPIRRTRSPRSAHDDCFPLLKRESLFLKLAQAGRRATFANAYTREHLEAPRPRWSATTRAVMAAKLPFRMWDDEGQRGSWDRQIEQADLTESLLDAVLRAIDLSRQTVIVISDHGNLEDSRHKRHTLNPVPMLIWGHARSTLCEATSGMAALTPTLVRHLTG